MPLLVIRLTLFGDFPIFFRIWESFAIDGKRCCSLLFRILRGSRDVVGGELWVRDTALAHCVLDPLCLCLGGFKALLHIQQGCMV